LCWTSCASDGEASCEASRYSNEEALDQTSCLSPTKREKKFRKTFEKMEGFGFVTPITGLSRLNTGKEDDDVASPRLYAKKHEALMAKYYLG
jgi:hypothetical protein